MNIRSLEKRHRGIMTLTIGVILLFILQAFFDNGMNWELKVLHSASESFIGIYIFYWATRFLIVKRVHELTGNHQRYRELFLILGAALVVAGALSG